MALPIDEEPAKTLPFTNLPPPRSARQKFTASLFVIIPIAVTVGIIALWRYDSRYGMTALGIVIVIVAGLMFWLKDKRLLY